SLEQGDGGGAELVDPRRPERVDQFDELAAIEVRVLGCPADGGTPNRGDRRADEREIRTEVALLLLRAPGDGGSGELLPEGGDLGRAVHQPTFRGVHLSWNSISSSVAPRSCSMLITASAGIETRSPATWI